MSTHGDQTIQGFNKCFQCGEYWRGQHFCPAPKETLISCPGCRQLHPLGHCLLPRGKTPHECPACDGWGKRTQRNAHMDGVHEVKCPACKGTGVVWEP